MIVYEPMIRLAPGMIGSHRVYGRRTAGCAAGNGKRSSVEPARHPQISDLTRFIRRVPAKLTYPTYSGMHTLGVGFLTVSTDR
ncbi:hypothetical protein [Plantactinospora endophytica]|uniref:Uncharacterized protein n=1 Tax=Plantactinospora endophytica TaxID=673535 RepID=A0ABQ4DTU7_9ACTN|nr:hypothetical protein [Plantactinospora endophytica]GIG85875.1 hypothetical protein Pen02_08110 [Plantactinospora endophytica]